MCLSLEAGQTGVLLFVTGQVLVYVFYRPGSRSRLPHTDTETSSAVQEQVTSCHHGSSSDSSLILYVFEIWTLSPYCVCKFSFHGASWVLWLWSKRCQMAIQKKKKALANKPGGARAVFLLGGQSHKNIASSSSISKIIKKLLTELFFPNMF